MFIKITLQEISAVFLCFELECSVCSYALLGFLGWSLLLEWELNTEFKGEKQFLLPNFSGLALYQPHRISVLLCHSCLTICFPSVTILVLRIMNNIALQLLWQLSFSSNPAKLKFFQIQKALQCFQLNKRVDERWSCITWVQNRWLIRNGLCRVFGY